MNIQYEKQGGSSAPFADRISQYGDAYSVASGIISAGNLTKGLAVLLGGALVLCGALFDASFGQDVRGLLLGILLAICIGTPVYLLGILISAQGQILKASLDTAKNTEMAARMLILSLRAKTISDPEAVKSYIANELNLVSAKEKAPEKTSRKGIVLCPYCGKKNPAKHNACQWCRKKYVVED